MSVRLHFLLSMLATALIPQTGGAQEFPTETRREIGKFLDATARKEISVGHITVDSVAINGNTLQLFANMNCSYIPFREDNVAEIYKGINALLPTEFAKYRLQLRTNRHSIEELIPQALRSKKRQKGSYIQPGCRKASGNQSFQTLYPNQRTAKPSYCLMAKPRLLLRTETQPLGMAARPLSANRGRPVYTELRIALPCSDAGKRRSQCAASA